MRCLYDIDDFSSDKNPLGMDNETASTLDEVNNRLAMVLLPNSIMLLMYIVFGLIGNTVVIYICKFRCRKPSGDRFFIPYLAGIDAMACVICSSANLIINFNPVRYTDDSMCKAFFMLSQFAAGSSALMLTIIAIERFQLVCRPFKPRMTSTCKRLVVSITVFSVFSLSIPSLFTTGIVPITNTRLNVTGYVCASVDVMGSRLFTFVYNILVLTVCSGNLIVLCALYVMIGKTIYGRVQYRKRMKNQHSFTTDGISDTCLGQSSAISNTSSSAVLSRVSNNTHAKKMRMAGNRMSMIFLVITAVYVLCFVPTLIAMLKSSLDRNDWADKTAAETLGLRTANTLYIINNIANPIIYGFFDQKMRNEMTTCLSKIC
ncbi:cholecystokinin receptor type A-like [Pecten maximus]|uniref:cholecystokinin receptor type A-like n=1 Tax=Pecten maximus TaxID=6579 RepID=UPI001458384C|nr:cholecystokinin receptor type A-like [Pecten maximus]